MKRIKFATILLITSIFFCGCEKYEDALIVKCNNTFYHIPNKDFKANVNRNYRKNYLDNDKSTRFNLRRKLAQERINSTIRSCMLDIFDYKLANEEVQKEIERTYKQYGSKENFEKEVILKHGLTEKDIFENHSYKLKQKKLIKQMGVHKITNKDVEEYYNKYKHKFTTPEKIYVHDILIKTNYATLKREIIEQDKHNKLSAAEVDDLARKAQSENEKLIQELEGKLKENPKNFPNFAKIYSQDKEKAELGGEFIYIKHQSSYPQKFIETIEKLQVGEVSKPTISQYGTHFLYKREIVPEKIQPLSEVKEEIRENILEDNFSNYLELATEKYKNEYLDYTVTYFDKTLDPNYKLPKNPIKRFIDTFGK